MNDALPSQAHRWSALWLALALALVGPQARAQPSDRPYSEAVAARFPVPAGVWDAPVFAPGRAHFTTNDELGEQLRALQRAPAAGLEPIELVQAGRSQNDLPIRALRFAPGAGKPVVLLIGQQHGDEPAAAEALLMLARELARPVKSDADLPHVLKRLQVIVLPRANPDGADWSRRVASNGIDINRDHLLLRTPEAQALAQLVLQHRPVVVVDAHEHTVIGRYLQKFGAVQRNDMLLQYAMTPNLPARMTQASEAWFRQPMLAALAAEGLRVEWYYTNPTPPGDLRLSMGGVQPDTSRNVQGLRHSISLLIESRGVGIGRWHLERRVHSQLVAMRSVLRSAALHADELLALQRAADADVSNRSCKGEMVVLAATTPTRRDFLMLDPMTGADKSVAVQWDSALELQVLTERARPCGYWLAASQSLAADRLRSLGITVDRIDAPRELSSQAWIERARLDMARPDVRGSAADGGQAIVRVEVDLRAAPFEAPAGSYFVSMNQPLANLVAAALEPDTPNSWFANRLLPSLEVVRRIMAAP